MKKIVLESLSHRRRVFVPPQHPITYLPKTLYSLLGNSGDHMLKSEKAREREREKDRGTYIYIYIYIYIYMRERERRTGKRRREHGKFLEVGH